MSGAETLSIVASVIAIVQISKTILSLCHFYIDGVEGAPSDLRVILIEISALKGIAKSLQYLTQTNVATSALSNQIAGITGPIEGCKKALKELEALFPSMAASAHGQTSKPRKLSLLAWPLKSGKAKKLLQEIIQHKTTINLALTAEFIYDLKDVKTKTDQIQVLLTETERTNIYKWLETTNPSDVHNLSQRLYESGTGSWVHRTPEWPLWIDGTHRCLWIHGIPGAGKSILASYIAEKIDEHCKSVSTETCKLGHAYYYCYFGHNQDESSHFLRWIIGQLCRQSGKLSQELHDIYKSGKAPSLPSLLSVLHGVMQDFKRVYIILDAVDESMPRESLLSVTQDLSLDVRFSGLSLLVTSRRYIDIEQVWKHCSVPISMSNLFVEEDIRSFVRAKVHLDPRYKRWPDDLLEEMKEIIPRKAEGMFRWAVCQLDILKRLKPEVSTIKAALSNLPKTLDETYDRIFLAIPEDDWLSVQHVFHWLAYHDALFGGSMPLSTLLQAVQTSTENLLTPNADQLYDFEGLHECCGCLIIVEQKGLRTPGSYHIYKRAPTVSFAHYSVKEYLQSPRLSKKALGFFVIAEERIRKEFAEVALQQALAIPPDSLKCYKDEKNPTTIYDLLTSNFQLYCGFASAIQLYVWPKTLASDSNLLELSEELVNSYRPAYPDLASLLYLTWQTYDIFEKAEFSRDILFWKVNWRRNPAQASAIFLSFLVTSAYSDMFHLALAFARKHSMLTLLTQQLHIEKPVWDETHLEEEVGWASFTGTIPQMAAQWAYRQPLVFSLILDLITDLSDTRFDLSSLLLLYIGSHHHPGCTKSCSLKRLLELGANANGPESVFVSPLQIATACWDLDGVERLLNAGADPNPLGGTNLASIPEFSKHRYSHLHKSSPLCIIGNSVCILGKSVMKERNLDETTRRKVETRLLESGAVVIEPESEDLASLLEFYGPHGKRRY